MDCPRCTHRTELSEVVKHGVVIDHCPTCGGVWLDKGELAKILGQMKQVEAEFEREFAALRPQGQPYGHPQEHGYGRGYKHKRPKTTMERLFDIFD
jgi:hypothetical protein